MKNDKQIAKELDREFARLNILIGRMLNTIGEYADAFQRPVPMKVLSAKFARSFGSFGGLPSVIEQLKGAGHIRIFLTLSGSKSVLLKDSKVVPSECVEL